MKYTLEEQLYDHLLYGIFPSQLTSLVKTCVKAIELANEGKYEEFLPFNIMVDGKSGEQIKVSEFIENLRLYVFLEPGK